jgi:hypothetical protein
LNNDEQGKAPTSLSKWDVFALFAHTASELCDVASNFFQILTHMLDTQASFVDDEKSFHEYAARTIETLKEGE